MLTPVCWSQDQQRRQAVWAAFGGALAGGAIGYGLGSIDHGSKLDKGGFSPPSLHNLEASLSSSLLKIVNNNLLVMIQSTNFLKNIKPINATIRSQFNHWEIVRAPSITEAAAKTSAFDDRIFDNMLIDTHGGPGYLQIDLTRTMDDGKTYPTINAANINNPNGFSSYMQEYVSSFKALFQKIKIDGNCVFSGCNAGKGSEGNALLEAMYNLGAEGQTGQKVFNIYMNTAFSQLQVTNIGPIFTNNYQLSTQKNSWEKINSLGKRSSRYNIYLNQNKSAGPAVFFKK